MFDTKIWQINNLSKRKAFLTVFENLHFFVFLQSSQKNSIFLLPNFFSDKSNFPHDSKPSTKWPLTPDQKEVHCIQNKKLQKYFLCAYKTLGNNYLVVVAF
jgi:hypothetical protein